MSIILIMDFLNFLRPFIHYGLHFVFPVFFAYFFYKKNWKKIAFILLCTMLVDLDHLLAHPIFDPNRCSIGFHFLHQYWAISIYTLMLFFPKTRIIAIGLLFHMITDSIDCWMMNITS
ncbi:hypothetical protein UJ101_00619 [Flavobacteriaceae bacterium UJ101]|nr:hypothetical protein UJ101_00619 [Flavobacteriaceae bacterium UJ101]